MEKHDQVRQGDLFLKRIRKPSLKGATPEKADGGRYVIIEGEATGHAHAVPSANTAIFAFEAGRRVLQVSKDTTLSHEEHGAISLREGFYEIVRQREYTAEAPRYVAD